ncbi:MAG: TonB family protein [Desulfobacterales bacterium]
MKRFASAAAVAFGLHLLLFTLDVDRNEIRNLSRWQPDAVTIDLIAPPLRVEKAEQSATAALPEPSGGDAAEPADPQDRNPRVVSPQRAAPHRKTASPASLSAPNLEGKTNDEKPSVESQGWSEPPISSAEPIINEIAAIQNPSNRPPGDSESTDAARHDPSPLLQEATPDYDRSPPPEYPLRARQLGFEGTVLLNVKIDSNGGVEETAIAASSGYAMLDDSALRAVKSWVFKPARRGDRPVAAWVQVPVRFALNPGTADNR